MITPLIIPAMAQAMPTETALFTVWTGIWSHCSLVIRVLGLISTRTRVTMMVSRPERTMVILNTAMQKIRKIRGGKHVNLLEHATYLGQLGAGDPLQPMLGGIDIDAKEDGQEVENSRDQGGLCHGGIGNAQHFRHNKGGGAHEWGA